jgi:hypothetical protein
MSETGADNWGDIPPNTVERIKQVGVTTPQMLAECVKDPNRFFEKISPLLRGPVAKKIRGCLLGQNLVSEDDITKFDLAKKEHEKKINQEWAKQNYAAKKSQPKKLNAEKVKINTDAAMATEETAPKEEDESIDPFGKIEELFKAFDETSKLIKEVANTVEEIARKPNEEKIKATEKIERCISLIEVHNATSKDILAQIIEQNQILKEIRQALPQTLSVWFGRINKSIDELAKEVRQSQKGVPK